MLQCAIHSWSCSTDIQHIYLHVAEVLHHLISVFCMLCHILRLTLPPKYMFHLHFLLIILFVIKSFHWSLKYICIGVIICAVYTYSEFIYAAYMCGQCGLYMGKDFITILYHLFSFRSIHFAVINFILICKFWTASCMLQ